MSFQPIVPSGGLGGWVFLNATMDAQRKAFDAGPRISSDTAYFEARIRDISTAEELVNDRRLLRVALGAFGLQDDIDSRFLIRKVLEGGTADPDALANRLTDRRYKDLADAFGFGATGGPETQSPGFGKDIVDLFRRRSFENAVGESDQGLRLALNAQRELAILANDTGQGDTGWLRIMGTPPLRKVFETALGLPDGFAQLDLDRQLDVFKARAADRLGITDLRQLADEGERDKLVERFLLQDQIRGITVQSSSAIALTLLQAVQPFR
ncbi:flagellar protein, putative [Roseobacter sp. AzwK-3b]|uniref:DUF1217 domain-containing protein n=1 Tax=Roseobacter sp. AzwK-3b TaxID=351016 RepID=UPI0001569925|nr:DUF1217 domain-containing protein [Roseobacter sp. AzwK-3b]EDM73059.1 flagellar protein, putative [Roseobacter sp. AzwK-3b]